MKTFFLVLFFAGLMPGSAAALSINDLVGRWCQDDGSAYVFSRTQLDVLFADGKKSVLIIEKMNRVGERLDVSWRGRGNTIFELSSDGGTLIQLANTGGDNGPRRQFHRCAATPSAHPRSG